MAMQDWRVIVGGNIRRRRLELGLTQEQVALEAEIDLTYMGGIERGRRNPSLLVLVRVATVLKVVPADLVAVPISHEPYDGHGRGRRDQ